MARVSVIEQVRQDFPADAIRFEDFFVYVGDRTRAFINIDEREVRSTRADSNRGRNYVVFLVMFLYNRFRLLPAPGSLSHTLISEIEIARVRSFHARMQRVGNGVGYYEYWDGTRWRVQAVPVVDPDFQIQIPLPAPERAEHAGQDPRAEATAPPAGWAAGRTPGTPSAADGALEELESVPEALPEGDAQ